MALYSIISYQDSSSFGPTVLVVALYSLPFYAFAAFPISLYIDFSAHIKNSPNRVKALLYASCGGLAGLLGSVVYNMFFNTVHVHLWYVRWSNSFYRIGAVEKVE